MSKENWYTDSENFWKFRTILGIDRKGRRTLDFVPDRGGFGKDQRTAARVNFIDEVMKSEQFEAWLQVQDGRSIDVFVYGRDGMNFRATPNASYGYMYMWAWSDKAE